MIAGSEEKNFQQKNLDPLIDLAPNVIRPHASQQTALISGSHQAGPVTRSTGFQNLRSVNFLVFIFQNPFRRQYSFYVIIYPFHHIAITVTWFSTIYHGKNKSFF
jgi:hypothetical protein